MEEEAEGRPYGPFLVAALFCRGFQASPQDTHLTGVGDLVTYRTPPVNVETKLVLALQAGEYYGTVEIDLRPFAPGCAPWRAPDADVLRVVFDGSVRYATLPANFSVPFKGDGLYGVEVYLNGVFAVRSEFEVGPQPGPGPLPRMGMRPFRD
ncbi:MAG: hypothetical protein Q7R32_12190 [Dehalococcoidia bacterium]|nr:hypothetical protein [Dehalococcoidia bacterium]